MQWLKMCWKGVSCTEAANTIAAKASGGIVIAFLEVTALRKENDTMVVYEKMRLRKLSRLVTVFTRWMISGQKVYLFFFPAQKLLSCCFSYIDLPFLKFISTWGGLEDDNIVFPSDRVLGQETTTVASLHQLLLLVPLVPWRSHRNFFQRGKWCWRLKVREETCNIMDKVETSKVIRSKPGSCPLMSQCITFIYRVVSQAAISAVHLQFSCSPQIKATAKMVWWNT